MLPRDACSAPPSTPLFTRDCVSTQSTNTIVKCTDDTTVVGLISNSETAWREEVEHPERWSNDKTPALNSKETGDLGLQTATPGRASSVSTRGLSRSCQGPPTHLQWPKRPPLPSDAEEGSATATTADQQALQSAPLLSVQRTALLPRCCAMLLLVQHHFAAVHTLHLIYILHL